MSIRFIDSYDHYVTAGLLTKYTASAGNITISAGTGRNSTASLHTIADNAYVSKTFDSQTTWIVGFSLKRASLPGGYSPICSLYDTGTLHCDLAQNASGNLYIVRAGNTIIVGPSTLALTAGTTYFIEFKATISDTAGIGTVEAKVNGVIWLTNAGIVDSRNAGNASANVVRIGTGGYSAISDYDDLYICDGVDATATQGAANNNFLGDCRVIALAPDADGSYASQWTRTGQAGSDFANVDETTPNNDTDYLSSSTASHRSSWTFGNLSVSGGTVKGVQMNVSARKDDAGSRTLDVFARRATANTDLAANFALADSYLYWQSVWGKHPDGTAWTETEVNALEAGIKLVS